MVKLSCLTLEKMSESSVHTNIHTHPPVEPLQRLNWLRDVKMTEDVRVAGLHGSRASEQGQVHKEEVIAQKVHDASSSLSRRLVVEAVCARISKKKSFSVSTKRRFSLAR